MFCMCVCCLNGDGGFIKIIAYLDEISLYH